MSGPPVLLIAGPTASGKSALALRLAQKLGGEILGADSMQIYRDLRILTARPSAEDEALVPHHLVGAVDGAEAWSVGRWLEGAQSVLDDLARRDKPAIVVGGTGLYFRALTQGLAMIPALPLAARDAAEAEFNVNGEAGVRALLLDLDPEAEARIEAGDRQRLVRALAVVQHTGTPLSRWQAGTSPVLPLGSWRGFVLEPPRDELYRRCDARLQAMLHEGALEEVRALLGRKLSPGLPVMKAVGVREFARALNGEAAIHEALALAQQATRNYAKRQLTWFRNQTPDWRRVDAADDPVTLLS